VDDKKTVPAPADLVTLDLGGRAEAIWPYTSADLSVTPKDPLNLVFIGAADPLLECSGARSEASPNDAGPRIHPGALR
jgi:hypothetical protein